MIKVFHKKRIEYWHYQKLIDQLALKAQASYNYPGSAKLKTSSIRDIMRYSVVRARLNKRFSKMFEIIDCG